MVFSYTVFFICSFFSFISFAENLPVITGAEQLELYLPKLKNKNIALVVNHTSQINNIHLIDILLKNDLQVKKVFTPEHGLDGYKNAGQLDVDSSDLNKGLEIISLYKESKKLDPALLDGIDVVVFDIQDVGVRFFTYISTLHYVMEACASCPKHLIILDRPNPNANYIDGPILEKEQISFIGIHPIPIVYGLTIGELALMINGEKWLNNNLHCDLEIIPLKNYTHKTMYILPIKPSPNLNTQQAINFYPSLGLFEGTILSLGRGTEYPFQVIGYPDQDWGNFSFIPKPILGMDTSPKYKDKICYGLDLRNEPSPYYIDLKYLLHYYKLAKNKNISFFENSFNKHAGNTVLQEQIKSGTSEKKIRNSWQPKIKKYKKIRKKYLLYK